MYIDLVIEDSTSDLSSHILSRGPESDQVTSDILSYTRVAECKEWSCDGPRVEKIKDKGKR